MSIHLLPSREAVLQALEPYYSADRRLEAALPLRPMTALEQMYAYFNSDLG